MSISSRESSNCPSQYETPPPAAVEGSEAQIGVAFAETARLLGNRIRLFLSLPFASLDKMSLQTKLREIGERADQASPAR